MNLAAKFRATPAWAVFWQCHIFRYIPQGGFVIFLQFLVSCGLLLFYFWNSKLNSGQVCQLFPAFRCKYWIKSWLSELWRRPLRCPSKSWGQGKSKSHIMHWYLWAFQNAKQALRLCGRPNSCWRNGAGEENLWSQNLHSGRMRLFRICWRSCWIEIRSIVVARLFLINLTCGFFYPTLDTVIAAEDSSQIGFGAGVDDTSWKPAEE